MVQLVQRIFNTKQEETATLEIPWNIIEFECSAKKSDLVGLGHGNDTSSGFWLTVECLLYFSVRLAVGGAVGFWTIRFMQMTWRKSLV